MSQHSPRGMVYRCPACGVEVAVLARRAGLFTPRCCNQPMDLVQGRLTFYVCPACGAEIAVVKAGTGRFAPRCCNEDMTRAA